MTHGTNASFADEVEWNMRSPSDVGFAPNFGLSQSGTSNPKAVVCSCEYTAPSTDRLAISIAPMVECLQTSTHGLGGRLVQQFSKAACRNLGSDAASSSKVFPMPSIGRLDTAHAPAVFTVVITGAVNLTPDFSFRSRLCADKLASRPRLHIFEPLARADRPADAFRFAQAILVARHEDHMDMIGHQAIGPDFGPRPLRRIREQSEIQIIVAVFEECAFAPIAPLRHMMRFAKKNVACQAGPA